MTTLLTKPDFKLDTPNPNPGYITDLEWWLWLQCHKLEPSSKLGGFLAWKKGFHAPGEWNLKNYPDNYSIRDGVNRTGPGWSKSSAFDWTFPDAQAGRFGTIDKYTARLMKSALDSNDPRLDMILFEFYGNKDNDRDVDGYNELKEQKVSSDLSHLWHLHLSFIRKFANDQWGFWALYTVLAGWSVAQWRASLPTTTPPKPAPVPPKPVPTGLPVFRPGSRVLRYVVGKPVMTGTDVRALQTFIGSRHCGPADGKYGGGTAAGVRWYQEMRGLKVDGVAGPATWAPILRAIS